MLSRCRSDHPDHGDCCSRGLSLLKPPKMDRSIAKILCLPFFDDAFKAALRDLKIDRVEFWMAMEDESEDTPAQKIANVLPALTSSHEISDKILARSDMINTLAGLVTSSATRMRDEIAIDLGYGSAETFLPSGKRALSISQPTAPTPAQVGGRPGGLGPQAEVSSLQAAEAAERKKWGQRLQSIADRAGSAAGINDPARSAGLSHDEVAKLRTMAFEAGGFRTIRQNVRYWERFEEWAIARGAMIYPPTLLGITGYCLKLKEDGCGPSILPAFKYAVGWICKKLVMATPNLDLQDPQLKAIVDEVHLTRGRELKEAIPLPEQIVACMEVYVGVLVKEKKIPAAIFVWWALILIYSSLRFDDGVHVSPTSLQMSNEALLGMVWQTKVERKRRGTRFAVPMCSISDTAWLEIGWEVFQGFLEDRDFFLWDLQDEKTFGPAPITYARSLGWLKHFMLISLVHGSKVGVIDANELARLRESVDEVTWHSMRVTLLAGAVRENVDEKIIGLQANWKDPKQLVLKYARQRKELSVAMVKDLTGKIKESWKPDPDTCMVDEDEIELADPRQKEYIVKAKVSVRALSAADLKCHILDPFVSEEVSLCGRLKMVDAESVGSRPTCSVCQVCSRKSES